MTKVQIVAITAIAALEAEALWLRIDGILFVIAIATILEIAYYKSKKGFVLRLARALGKLNLIGSKTQTEGEFRRRKRT